MSVHCTGVVNDSEKINYNKEYNEDVYTDDDDI